jgi:hypothetical protein
VTWSVEDRTSQCIGIEPEDVFWRERELLASDLSWLASAESEADLIDVYSAADQREQTKPKLIMDG